MNMKPSFAFTSAVLLGLLSAACNRNNQDTAATFTLDSFEQIAVPDNAGTPYRSDSLFLGSPRTIRFHPDGYLVLLDRTETGQVTVIDLETGDVQYLIKRGRGPEEVISVRDLVIRNKEIWISGMMDQKILKLVPEKARREFSPQAACTAGEQFLRAVPFAEGRLLTLASVSSGDRFHLLDGEGAVRDTIGSFPAVDQPGITPDNAVCQSDITVSPDNRHVAAACQSLEYIDIYDGEMNLQKRLQGPQGFEPSLRSRETEMGVRIHYQDPLCLVYSDIVSDNRQFMVGYIGVRVKSESDLGETIGTVLSFDWKGNPLKAYTFESDILSFDMDWKNNVMYCLANRPEPQIILYDLDSLE